MDKHDKEKSRLVDTVRVPKGIRANIFERVGGEYGPYYDVKISRAYMKDGEVAFSTSFKLSELPLVEHAARKAFDRGLQPLSFQPRCKGLLQ